MKQAYGYIVRNGCKAEDFSVRCQFIIFADSSVYADKYIQTEYIEKEIEREKYKDDDGNMVNHWWKFYSVEKVPVSKFDNDSANIVWLE